MSLCVLRLSAIGDVCQTVPVVRTLRRAFPETPITWIIGRTEHGLVGDIPGVEFITFDKRDGLAGMCRVGRELAGREFDTLLQMQVALRASVLGRFVPAATRIGFDRARARDFQWLFTDRHIAARDHEHVMDGLFGFAEALGVMERDYEWDIPVPEQAAAFAEELVPEGRRTLVISPCSSARFRNFRNWAVERYAEVAMHAHQMHDMQVLVTGGPTPLEREYGMLIARMAATVGIPVTDLTGRTTLKELYALLGRATCLLGPDSGPVHMANACGTPVIGLYATSNPDRTGPFSDRRWTVNRYPEALLRATGKAVEKVRWGTRVRTPDAMDLITVDEVCDMLDALVETLC